MTDSDKIATFRSLHVPGTPLLMPNPWDAGSAKMLAFMGFKALATTSGGFAGTLGRLDGSVTQDEAIAHAGQLVSVVDLPVSADLENGFAADPDEVSVTVGRARAVGLAGCSIEDFSGDRGTPIYDRSLAVERVRAAPDAAHQGGDFVLAARSET